MRGRLILCATPIGNLEDMSPRAQRTIDDADVLACEDTRHTRKLLTHFGLTPDRLMTYNEANERRQTDELVKLISSGMRVVLVSDAGTPGLSDPGYRLVQAAAEAGFPVEVVPGPNAAVSALVISGLPTGRFVFEGFLPRKSSERIRHLEALVDEPRTMVFYESPHRVEACLADLVAVFGTRPGALARELTKMYEEVRRGTLPELLAGIATEPPRGEIVIVVGGAVHGHREQPTAEALSNAAKSLMEGGADRKTAMVETAKAYGVSKREVFDALVEGREG